MANNSRVQITLGFNADTDQAKRQINDLVSQLRSIQSTPTTLVDDTSLRKASAAAAELQGHLQKAVDTNTGKLDLSRFSASLKQSGKQLSDYRRDLEAIGPAGSQAFLSVAKSIATAETPLLRANKHLNDFLTTMKNTAKWQISSSIMHGFMGAVQQAYGYAQNLNESLNNIRIVTGYSTEQMAGFAEQANKAAKVLSTTTTEYTNASLIYFQQGLSDEEVQKRTDITVKMANVARDSVENVSNQLTAIWNNFYEEGGKSLEYYADVMTALGAKTASSTEEIAGGLEKFAAIGDTIGLSYEYAASALATITSNTRQSEEVVGTALKTIFARIQGLNLGETLDDGTSLNKYSEALAKVGISIFEQNGELKAMDNILDELAARWGTLNSAQQTSLAQTVAGVRQYTQLIALMENWNNGDEDSFMANIQTTQNAEGALNEQAGIYADSWEAARARVKAAQEDIYTSLINDEFFIQLDKYLVPVLETIDGLIDGFGGLGGIIATVGGIFISHFAKEIPGKIKDLTANISVLSGKATKAAVEMQKSVSADLSKAAGNKNQSLSYQNELAITSQKAKLYAELNERASQMSEEERKQYELALQQIDITGKQILEESERLDLLKQQNKERERQINSSISTTAREQTVDSNQLWREQIKATSDTKKSANKKIQNIQRDLKSDDPEKRANAQRKINQLTDEGRQNTEVYNKVLKQNQQHLINQKKALLDSAKAVEKMELSFEKASNVDFIVNGFQIDNIDADKIDLQQFENVKNSIKDVVNEFQQLGLVGIEEYEQLIAIIDNTSSTPIEVKNAWKEFFNAFADSTASSAAAGEIYAKLDANADKLAQSLNVSADELRQWAQQAAAGEITAEELKKRMESLANASKNLGISTVQIGELFGHATGTLVSYAGMLSSINSGMEQLYDTNATGMEKFGTVVSMLTSFGSSLGVATTGFSKLSMMIKPAGEGVATFSNTTSGATGKFGHFITSLTAGQAAANGMSASAATLAGVLGIVAIAVTAAIAAFAIGAAIVQKNLDAEAERATEAAEKTQEYAEGLREADKANSAYIKDLKQSLNVWEDTEENLTAVNETVDALTEAYDLQSGALAKLTGRQEDYNRVLKEAKEAEQREKQERISAESDNIEAQIRSIRAEGRAIQDGMTGRLSSYNQETGQLQLTFDGGSFLGSGEKESQAAKILEEAFKEAGLDSKTQYGNAASRWLEANGLGLPGTLIDNNRSATIVSFDANDVDAYIKAYDAVKTAMSEMEDELGDQAYTQDVYKDAKAWTNAVGSAIEKLKESQEELQALELQVGDAADQLFDVSSYEQYESWLIKTTTALENAGKSVEEVDEAIKLLEDTSLNPAIQQFVRFKNALNGAATITGLDPKTIENAIRDALPSDATIEEILTFTGTINFNAVFNKDQLNAVVRNAETYANYTTANEQKGTLQDSIVKLNNGELESSDYANIADIIEFANERRVKQIDYNEFFKADEDHQREVLKELYDWVSLRTANYGNRLTNGSGDSTEVSLEFAQQAQKDILKRYNVKNLEELQAKLESYQKAVDNTTDPRGKSVAQTRLDNLNEDIATLQQAEDAIKGYKDQEIQIAADTALAEKAIKELNEIEVEIKVDAKVEAEQLALEVVDAQIASTQATINNPNSSESEKAAASEYLKELEKRREEILNEINVAATAESSEIISNMQAWATDPRNTEFMQNLKSVTKDGERIFTDEEIKEFQNALANGNIDDLINQLLKILPKLEANSSNSFTYWNEVFDESTAKTYEEDYNTFINNMKVFVTSWVNSTNTATKATEDLSESAKEAAKELEQVKWYDAYDAEKPIDNREARLEGDLKQAQALGKQISGSFVESTAQGLEQALKDRQILVNEQLADTKADIQKEGLGALFGANGDLLNGQDLAVELNKQLNDERAKGDQADENRINQLEKQIELLNKYNSLMGESIDLYYELNTYTGDTYHLKSLAEEVDLYAELEKELTYIDDALEDIRREKNKAYGKDYIQSLDKENKAIEKQNELLKQKIQVAKEQIPVQQGDIQIALGLLNKTAQAEFDAATGRLLNGNEIRAQLAREMASQQEGIMAALNAGNIALANTLNEAYENNKKLYEQIIATLDALAATEQLIIDTENTIEDNMSQIMSNNSEMWRHKIEVEIQIDDNDLEIIDKKISVLGDNLYSMAEAAGLLLNKLDGDGNADAFSGLGKVREQMDDISASWAELESLFEGDQITQKDFIDNAQMLFDQVAGNIDKLMEIDKEMMEYYSKAIDAAGEEMDYYTSQLEHFSSVLDHYRNIVEIVNGEMDFERTGAILEGRVKTLQNEMKVSEDYYAMLKREQDAAKAALASATDEKEKELLEANLKAITEAVIEAEEEMLSKTEEWAEATKELMENTMAKAARDMELAFTDGLTFDFLSDSMDRLSTYQDEYLTKTNQMYETEKLMRTAQQAADKTQNKVAKERLQGYIKETSQLQNKNKLSHLELEIQQAKYDLLLAEIALEEAQNAKSTVRLQRDSEGNFGYVYTADSDKISQAEQDLADAENDLYNIGLEAANDYGQKRIELQQQLADDLIELEERRVNGEFKTEEDYYRARDQLISEYTDLFTAYSNQYTTAMGVDADIQEEAWVTSYQNIIDKTNMWSEDSNAAFESVGNGIGEWKNIVNGYLGECETAYGEWRAVVETESKVVQGLMTDTQGAVDAVTTASDNLATEVITVVIPGIEAELSAIREITTAYAAHRDGIYELMNQYLELMDAINAAISAAAGISDITIPTVKVDDTNTPSPTDPGKGEDTSAGGGGGGTTSSGGNMAYAQSLYWQGKVTDINEAAQMAGTSVTEFKQAANYLASQTYGTGKDRWFTSEFGANLPSNYAQQYNSGWAAIEDNPQAQDRINEILGFDTGGYTGAWGTEGRLAFLHQKELVLKPEDTQNFLAATNLLRDIANVIDLQAMYNQMTSPTASTIHGGGGFFEQSVHIEASFPNVQDRNEIQEAFNNLLNTASQYANRK